MLTADRRTPRWLRQMQTAIRLNAHDLDLWSIVRKWVVDDAPPGEFVDAYDLVFPDMAEEAAKHIRAVCKYRFEGDRHRVLELAACRRRGFAACADASAFIAATVLAAGGECGICYERACPSDAYAHVRVAIGDRFVDAFPEFSLDVPSCAAVLQVTRRLVRWPVNAERTARTILDGTPPSAGPPQSPEGSTK